MNKTPDPGEVVRDKVIPAAEELVASLAERVAPLTHQAMEAVTPLAHQAVEAVTPFAQQTRDAVAPYAQQAADLVSPYAAQMGPLAHQAADRVGPLAHQAADAVAPYAALIAEQGRRSSHDLADRLEPAIEAAKDAFTGARDRVSADYLPAVGAAAATAAASASPFVTAATDRGKALVQSVRNEPVVVLPPPKKKRGWFTTLAIVGAAAAATYVLVRKLVGDKGSQWQTARPTTPYSPPVSAEAGVATPVAEPEPAAAGDTEVVASTTSLYGTVGSTGAGGAVDDADASAIAARNENLDEVADVDDGADAAPEQAQTAGTWGEGSATDAATSSSDAGTPTTPTSDGEVERELETAEERVYEEPEDAVTTEQDTALGGGPDSHPDRYDLPGVYVGVEPPTGYAIKGNERSMKYHVPDSNSYDRTIAQVWFDSEDAAQRAGFTRAQH